VDVVVCTPAVKKKIRAGFDMSDRTIPLLVGHSGTKEEFAWKEKLPTSLKQTIRRKILRTFIDSHNRI
jgi:hypothetical protein